MPHFLPDLARREFCQLTVFQFEEPDANVLLESTHERSNEKPFPIAAITFVVSTNVDTYQDPESPIPDVVERDTASSANDVVRPQ